MAGGLPPVIALVEDGVDAEHNIPTFLGVRVPLATSTCLQGLVQVQALPFAALI